MAKPVQGRNNNGSSNASAAASTSRETCATESTSKEPLSHEESASKLRALGFGVTLMEGTAPPSDIPDAEPSCDSSTESVTGDAGAQFHSQYNGLRRRLLSPFEVHFSQSHIRPEFQDGRTVEEATASIASELLCTPPDIDAEEIGMPPADSESGSKGWFLLKPPFPEVEVLQWRCKLRKEDGTIMTDEQGMELYGELQWYSLDNRRLYCLQYAAAQLYPAEVRCPVITIRQEDGNYREFRKFRTPDLGRTVGIGHKDSGDLPRWSWRKQVGLPELPPPVGAPIPGKTPQRRKSNGRPNHGRGRHRNYHDDDEEEDSDRWDPVMNVMFFILIYAALRMAFQAVKYVWNDKTNQLTDSMAGLGAILGIRSAPSQ